MNLPQFNYGPAGIQMNFAAKLQPIKDYEDLRSHVFQAFREVGNFFCFAYLLDKALVRVLSVVQCYVTWPVRFVMRLSVVCFTHPVFIYTQ